MGSDLDELVRFDRWHWPPWLSNKDRLKGENVFMTLNPLLILLRRCNLYYLA